MRAERLSVSDHPGASRHPSCTRRGARARTVFGNLDSSAFAKEGNVRVPTVSWTALPIPGGELKLRPTHLLSDYSLSRGGRTAASWLHLDALRATTYIIPRIERRVA